MVALYMLVTVGLAHKVNEKPLKDVEGKAMCLGYILSRES
mgnify:FL=1